MQRRAGLSAGLHAAAMGDMEEALLLCRFAESGHQLAFGATSSQAMHVADAQAFPHAAKFCRWQRAQKQLAIVVLRLSGKALGLNSTRSHVPHILRSLLYRHMLPTTPQTLSPKPQASSTHHHSPQLTRKDPIVHLNDLNVLLGGQCGLFGDVSLKK